MKTAKERFPLAVAAHVALAMVPSAANLDVVRRAIAREVELLKVLPTEVAEMLILAAKEEPGPLPVNRFWFEDSRWRSKDAYRDFRKRHFLKHHSEESC